MKDITSGTDRPLSGRDYGWHSYPWARIDTDSMAMRWLENLRTVLQSVKQDRHGRQTDPQSKIDYGWFVLSISDVKLQVPCLELLLRGTSSR
jgi:hypothetical protein